MFFKSVNNLSRLLFSKSRSFPRVDTLKRNLKTSDNANQNEHNKRIKSTLYYVTAAGVLVAGFSYAAVPLYRMFCQVSL